ncbi:hypothetical protein STRAU_2707 [Streptomyces aurantiacus JA 4570]|uniref:Uncharacterized protein n=1 Tax=Streptomyces aurantiacus JA 4570 TaxID=1286094 RepID=S4AS68_9ACTN|nr:hypothetical protein STRAU_2707 [Streptomyces aurantiacus JA 4570]
MEPLHTRLADSRRSVGRRPTNVRSTSGRRPADGGGPQENVATYGSMCTPATVPADRHG